MLLKISRLIQKRYKAILLVSVLLAILNIYLTSKLKLETQWSDMLPSNEPAVIAFNDALKNFEGLDGITVIVEGEEENIIKYIQSLKDPIAKLANIKQVIAETEKEFFLKNGLLLLKNSEINSLKDILKASSLEEFIQGLNNSFEKEYIASDEDNKISKEKAQILQQFNTIEDFLDFLAQGKPNKNKAIKLATEFSIGKSYMISPDRTMGLMFVKTTLDPTEIDDVLILINTLESLVKSKQSEFNVKAGISGFLVVSRDEMVACEKDMAISTLLTMLLIIIIFYVSFRLLRYTVLAFIPLIMGVIYSMGMTYLVFGTLNIFTAMMGAILIGLGIDYAIHILSLYTEERHKGKGHEECVERVFKKVAKGVVTGSVTTAIGFMMFGLSSFLGFREFGIVLGIGIICTLLSSIFILPSLLMVFGRKEVKVRESSPLLANFIEQVFLKRPVITIIGTLLVIGLLLLRVNHLRFSTDIKDIEPKNLESLVLNDKIIEKFDFSPDTILIVSNTLDEAAKFKERAEDINSIEAIDSIINYLPPIEKQQKRINLLKDIAKEIPKTVGNSINTEKLKKELDRLKDNLIELSDLAYMGGEQKIVKKVDQIIKSQKISSVINILPNKEKTLNQIQQTFIGKYKSIILQSNKENIISIKDLPETIKRNYIGKDGALLTSLYPEGDVWSNHFQPILLADLKQLKTASTGTFMMFNRVMEVASAEGNKILLIVMSVIFIILLIDFRSLKYALLALIPMVFTLITLVGIMSMFDIAFNYVNIIALPIIIGIGIDDGLHLIHRYLIEKDISPTLRSTGRGILLSSITTTAAFGTLMTATYQGFFSFGLILVIGILTAYFLTVVLIPAFLQLIDKKQIGNESKEVRR